MQIGIFCPYRYGETAAAAIRLARLAQASSLSVDFISNYVNKEPIDPVWDRQVKRVRFTMGDAHKIYSWAKDSVACVWFGVDMKLFKLAVRCVPSRKHILVLPWHQWQQYRGILGVFNCVVCPTRSLFDAVTSINLKSWPIHHVWWPGGLSPARKVKARTAHEISLFVAVDGYTTREHGAQLFHALKGLLASFEKLTVSLCLDRKPVRRDRPVLAMMRELYGDRFHRHHRMPIPQLQLAIHQHDWLLVPSVRSNFGFPAQYAIGSGVPVIAWNVSPFNEVIVDTCTGVLVDCKVRSGKFGMPAAVWSSSDLVEHCAAVLYNDEPLGGLISQEWPAEEDEKHFRDFWSRLWWEN